MDYGLYRANQIMAEKLQIAGFNKRTFGDPAAVDLDKNTVYPLSHMSLDGAVINDATQVYNYRVWVFDAVDYNSISPRETLNNLLLSDNLEDVLHSLAEQVNIFHQAIRKDLDVEEATESLSLTTYQHAGQNDLVAYQFTISITIEGAGSC